MIRTGQRHLQRVPASIDAHLDADLRVETTNGIAAFSTEPVSAGRHGIGAPPKGLT
ncbi:hypothetical protein [Aliidongia dinghuensis]|uniref:hypothetical protein n=1 Tax=Aliidongia dinghuensis TaxID=1867774 RepID=UPI00166BE09D|nr:hypothetical protein [Aliidongia dinghuensis]